MSKTYDVIEVGLYGWFEGEDDCEPPEPDKRWMTLAYREEGGGEGGEIAVFVQRKVNGVFRDEDERRVMDHAGIVFDAMKAYYDA